MTITRNLLLQMLVHLGTRAYNYTAEKSQLSTFVSVRLFAFLIYLSDNTNLVSPTKVIHADYLFYFLNTTMHPSSINLVVRLTCLLYQTSDEFKAKFIASSGFPPPSPPIKLLLC